MMYLRDAIADGFASLLARLPPDPPWRKIGAAAGGVAVVVVLYLLAGLFRPADGGGAAVEARLARAEQQLRELSGRAPPPTVIPKIVDDLGSRIARLEAARPPATDPALLERIAALEGAYNANDEKVGSVARRSDEVGAIAREAGQKADAAAVALADLSRKVAQLGAAGAGQGDLDALTNRTVTLERAIKLLEAELLKRSTGEASDRPLRLAVAAAALNAAVERGDGFAGELAATKALATDVRMLAPLDSFAMSGVPSAVSLGRELLALMPALTQLATTQPQPRQGGVFDRLQANAERLVRIRPIDDVPGDDPAAVLARIEFRATQSDIPGVLTELAKLPAASPAQAWMTKAQARIAAIAASRQFAAQAFAALGKAP
jgi:hypothetical protein